MGIRKLLFAGVCLGIFAMMPASVHAQCTSSQNAAVECFVSNALKTNLTSLRYGMTTSQFKSYGVAVSKILQDQQTYIVLLGLSGAVADAMPPTNADGSANVAAQQAAMNAIVSAAVTDGLATIPQQSSQQDLEWFALDVVSAMNESSGVMLSPGTLLRVVDSYIVTATAGGTVNWTTVNNGLATMVSNLASAGLLKLSPSVTLSQAQAFAQSLAQAIYTYKVATGRSSL